MDILQISLFFLISYLLSRVFVMLKIPELVVYYLFEKRHVSIQKLTLILILGSSLISTIIANVITVLTLMPLVLLLQKGFKGTPAETKKMNTLFLLSVIWGANIGGIGMVTGTTTNGILIGLFELYKLPVADSFTFLSWMGWGMPLAIFLTFAGWGILMLVFKPGNISQTTDFETDLTSIQLSRKLQMVGFALALAFILSAAGLSYLLSIEKVHKLYVLIATVIWTIIFLYLLMFRSYKTENNSHSRLLLFKDTLHDLPIKGIIWIAVGIALAIILWQLNFHQSMAMWLTQTLHGKQSLYGLYLLFALISTFGSELISNSAVQISSFMVLFPMTKFNPDVSWQAMLIITLSSTCAFMTPLATPSNGLGFGSSGKVSLKYMLFAGFLMNLISSVAISTWILFVVPVVLTYLG